MLANISTLPTPSVTAWLRCNIVAARPSASPSTSVAVHSGREMSSGDCRRNLGQIHHLTQRAGLGNPQPAHMEVQVEVGVDHPPRRRGGQRRHDHLLPQPQHLARRVIEPGPEAVPVGGGVQDLERP